MHTSVVWGGSSESGTLTAAELIHELRTPLQAAILASELIEGEGLPRQTLDSALTHMRALLDQASGLSDECSELADLHETILEAVSLCDPSSRVVMLDQNTARGDWCSPASAIRQILVVLLVNALKFSPPATPVQVKIDRAGDQLHVNVTDQGPGVPAGEQEVIFAFGVRGSQVGVAGEGLGLGIARRMAESIGGYLRLTASTSKGCTFTLTLPRYQA